MLLKMWFLMWAVLDIYLSIFLIMTIIVCACSHWLSSMSNIIFHYSSSLPPRFRHSHSLPSPHCYMAHHELHFQLISTLFSLKHRKSYITIAICTVTEDVFEICMRSNECKPCSKAANLSEMMTLAEDQIVMTVCSASGSVLWIELKIQQSNYICPCSQICYHY